jgi:hypothetical protein
MLSPAGLDTELYGFLCTNLAAFACHGDVLVFWTYLPLFPLPFVANRFELSSTPSTPREELGRDGSVA